MLNTLLEISRTIISTLDFERVNEGILKEALRLFNKDYGALFVLDKKSGHLALTAAHGLGDNELENLKILGAWEQINQTVLNSNAPLIVNDIASMPELGNKNFPFRAFLSKRLDVENLTVGVLTLSNKEPQATAEPNQERVLEILANYAAIALVNARLYKETEDLFISLISSLVAAIDAKDPYTAGHSQRVTNIALSIAEEMELSRDWIKDLKLAAILHDIGKIGITESILAKPTELSEQERKVIHKHPEIGVKIVSSIPHLEKFIRGIIDHHEFYNGNGYPEGLRAEEISLQGRIISVADTFDALTSDRAYRKGLKPADACEEIKRNSGTQFDPKVVEAFLRVFQKKPEIFCHRSSQ